MQSFGRPRLKAERMFWPRRGPGGEHAGPLPTPRAVPGRTGLRLPAGPI